MQYVHPNTLKTKEPPNRSAFKEQFNLIRLSAQRISQKSINFVQTLINRITKSLYTPVSFKLQCHISNPTPSSICSKIIGQSTGFKCNDCKENEFAIQCRECFNQADHKGHDYYEKQLLDEGSCDCGNEQVWSLKGTCPQHSQKVKEINVPEAQKQLFIKEGALLFFVVFWLQERKDQQRLRIKFVKDQINSCFKQMLTLVQQNYSLKVLCFELLSQSFSSLLPTLPKLSLQEKSIIEKMFKGSNDVIQENFQLMSLELFSVEPFQIAIIEQYFDKSRTDPSFIYGSNMTCISFQFLTAFKKINNLMRQSKLQPLRLPPLESILKSNQKEINQLFLRFIYDTYFQIQIKGSLEYFQLIVQKYNFAEIFLSYRELPDQVINKIELDQYFLKIAAKIIKMISPKKKLLQKLLKQLWLDMKKLKGGNSLVHERVFALTLSAYLEGGVRSLVKLQTLKQIQQLLNLASQQNLSCLKILIENHLKHSIQLLCQKSKETIDDKLKKTFELINPEKNIHLVLDVLFQKIMILFRHQAINYSSIVKKTLMEIIESENTEKIVSFISFINSIFSIELDEIVVQNLVGSIDKKMLQQFYGRFINTFPEIKAVEIKNKINSVVFNKEEFEEFVKDHCWIEKECLKTRHPFEPLSFIQNSFILNKFNIKLNDVKNKNLSSQRIQYLDDVSGWDTEAIKLIGDTFQKALNKKFLPTTVNSEYRFLPSIFGLQLIQISIRLKVEDEYLKYFLSHKLPIICEELHCDFLRYALNKLITHEDKPTSQEILDTKKQEERKRKLELKRKQKLEQMKEKRNNMLEKLNVEDPEKLLDEDICNSCKQNTNQDLQLLSTLSIKILDKCCFFEKINFMLCFRTCGHKIHRSCFNKNELMAEKKCLLCSEPTNFLMSDFQKSDREQKSKNFIESIRPILLQQYEIELNTKEDEFFQVPLKAILLSILNDIVLFGSYTEINAKQKVKPITQQLLLWLKVLPQKLVKKTLSSFEFNKKEKQSNQQLEFFNKASELLGLILFEQKQFQSTYQSEDAVKIKDIINLLMNNGQYQQISRFQLFDAKNKLNNLPLTLHELQKQTGICPECKKKTEKIIMCLICKWKVCIEESQKLLPHFIGHGSTIFIACYNGNLIYFGKNKATEEDSIYINYLGESYKRQQYQNNNPLNYQLNKPKFEKIKEQIIQNELIEQVLQSRS